MKKFIFVLFLSLTSSCLTAQITNLIASEDSSLVVNNVYVGVLNTTSFSTQALSMENNPNFRVGAQATWQALSWLQAKGFAVYDRNAGTDKTINSFSLKIHSAGEKLGLEFGQIPTLSSESRPSPPSANGQFETWTQSKLPGIALGAKASIQLKNVWFGAGANVRNDKPEYHIKISSGIFDVTSCYSTWDKKTCGSVKMKTGSFYSLSVFENIGESNLLANTTNFPIVKKNGIFFYSDFGWQIDQSKIIRWEMGFFKTFQAGPIKGLLCLSYVLEKKGVNAYFFIHI